MNTNIASFLIKTDIFSVIQAYQNWLKIRKYIVIDEIKQNDSGIMQKMPSIEDIESFPIQPLEDYWVKVKG